MKEPWGEGTPWKNSVAFFTYLRGCLRKAWSRNPIKHDLLKAERKQIPNPKAGQRKGAKETVWGCKCAMCGNDYVMADVQVDHIVEAGTLTCTEDIQGFVERLLYVTKDDLRVVCKECNSALAYASKHDMSFGRALAVKQAIKLENTKQDLTYLEKNGIIPGRTKAVRRDQIVDSIMGTYEIEVDSKEVV